MPPTAYLKVGGSAIHQSRLPLDTADPIRFARYDAIKPNNYGINLENSGVAPDVFVENSPEDELQAASAKLRWTKRCGC